MPAANLTVVVYVGDMLGLGALALPSVFARLGWLPASALLAACALGALYSGRLFTAMAQQVSCLCQSCMLRTRLSISYPCGCTCWK